MPEFAVGLIVHRPDKLGNASGNASVVQIYENEFALRFI
jgi:hypothetical protein